VLAAYFLLGLALGLAVVLVLMGLAH